MLITTPSSSLSGIARQFIDTYTTTYHGQPGVAEASAALAASTPGRAAAAAADLGYDIAYTTGLTQLGHLLSQSTAAYTRPPPDPRDPLAVHAALLARIADIDAAVTGTGPKVSSDDGDLPSGHSADRSLIPAPPLPLLARLLGAVMGAIPATRGLADTLTTGGPAAAAAELLSSQASEALAAAGEETLAKLGTKLQKLTENVIQAIVDADGARITELTAGAAQRVGLGLAATAARAGLRAYELTYVGVLTTLAVKKTREGVTAHWTVPVALVGGEGGCHPWSLSATKTPEGWKVSRIATNAIRATSE